jgi:hypothetical protein
MLPIVSADKKGVYVADGKRERRVPWSTPCRASAKTSVSNQLMAVENMSHDFYYGKTSKTEDRADSDIRKKDRDIAFQIAQIGPGGAGSSNAEAIAALEKERDNFEDQVESMIYEKTLVVEGHADSVSMRLSLTPSVHVQEALCAVMVVYRKTGKNLKTSERRLAVGVQRWGDLVENTPKDVSFTLFLAEGYYRDARLELFLFSGDGSPLPSNLSRNLQMLTNAEYENVR